MKPGCAETVSTSKKMDQGSGPGDRTLVLPAEEGVSSGHRRPEDTTTFADSVFPISAPRGEGYPWISPLAVRELAP